MRVLVSGSTGLVGTALVAALPRFGHDPVRLVRQNQPGDLPSVSWDPAAGVMPAQALDDIDAVVHLAGEGIAEKRWSDDQKARILDSRVDTTSLLAEAISRSADPPRIFLSGSAIGYYGSRGDEILDEASTVGEGFLTDVVVAWEAATEAVDTAATRVAYMRTGVVLSAEGGALAELLPFFRFGIGGRIGDGHQWWSWISIDDLVRAIIWMLDNDVHGPVNLTAPNPVTNAELTKTLGQVLRRPAVLPTPKPALWARLGRELTKTLLYDSQRIMPTVLTEGGFVFDYRELEPALRAILDRPA